MQELTRLDAMAQAELVRRGEVSPRELVDAAIARIEKTNPAVHAVVSTAFDRARDAAVALEAEAKRGAKRPFLGVPFLMKDIGGQEAGAPYHMGMKCLKRAQWTEAASSHFTEKLYAAGFVSLGRTNTPELALLPTTEPEAYGATANPWNLGHSAGGSSGGAAAAVAAGMVPAAHASDGGGSIRIPASHCGLVGLKPTRARASFGPAAGERWSGFSCEHVVSHSVRDTAAILDVVAGRMPGDPYSAAPPSRPYLQEIGADPGRLRIGVLAGSPREGVQVDPACSEAARIAARALASLGHHVEESSPEAYADTQVGRSYVTLVASNIARSLDAVGEKLGRTLVPDDVENTTWAVAQIGRATTAPAYLAMLEWAHAFGRRMAAWWEGGFDLLVTPVTAEPPPPLGQFVSPPDVPLKAYLRAAPFGAFTFPINLTGQPAISLPLHHTESGLPVGAMLTAAYGREDLLLRVAAQLEQAVPWRERRAPGYA
ncbi:MAG: amidase [Myxococcota bacterium]|jgi:amidase|nr:amidase [Myxococcota bacterium]